MSNILIVYFSHKGETYFPEGYRVVEKGNANIIAEKVQSLLNADIFEIRPVNKYPVSYKECCEVAKEEYEKGTLPKLEEYLPNIKRYDTIVLVYPCWWGTIPQAMFTFLKKYDFKDKEIYPICTHEGSAMGKSEIDLVNVCTKARIHRGLAIKGSKVNVCDASLREYFMGLLMKEN